MADYRRHFESALRENGDGYGYALFVNSRLVEASELFLEWTEYERDGALGRGAIEFTAPEHHERLIEHAFSEKSEPTPMRGLTASGRGIEWEVFGRSIENDLGDFVRLVRFRKF